MRITVGEGPIRDLEKVLVESMGEWHSYYAIEAVRSGIAQYLLGYINGKLSGGIVYYTIPTLSKGNVTVIYYVAVLPSARGLDLGRILVLSVEEVSASQAYMATIAEGNTPSTRMFESIGYKTLKYSEVEAMYGHAVVRKIARAACGYEDHIIAVKPEDKGLEYLIDLDDSFVEKVFRIICYEPWRRLAKREAIRIY